MANVQKVRELANEIKVVEVPEEYNSKERSRYIKTTFRNYLSGNLLLSTQIPSSQTISEMLKIPTLTWHVCWTIMQLWTNS